MSEKHFDMSGMEFFDVASETEMKYFYPENDHPFAGWIAYKHPDGQWVSLRKASDQDLVRLKRPTNER